MKQVSQLARHARGELSKAIVGQQLVLDQMIAVLLTGGHALLEGPPGVAKTLAVKALSLIFRLQFHRVQCTADLMPSDLLGTNVMNLASGSFELHRGPVFTDLLLVDEINRTPPRTQAALLEAMEEHQVTIDGLSNPLSEFFTVLATQNPIEFEGTYPLPEAQLDRFLAKVRIGYPDQEQETQILKAHHEGFVARKVDQLGLVPIEPAALTDARIAVKSVSVEAGLLQYITAIARRTREWPVISLGASPRAAIGLLLTSKSLAAMDDRDYVIPDDVKAAAPMVLAHRLVLRPEADLEGLTAEQVIGDILANVAVPK